MEQTLAAKPRVALLGEFSAGKSTLANVLLGQPKSPVRVTATQMPPLWYVAGQGPSVQVRRDGTDVALDAAADIAEVPLSETRALRIPMGGNLLDRFDLLDLPGSSDPNMAADAWDAVLPLAEIAIWCTPATQAWRQSEAAIWESLPDALHRRSLLLLTRMDKVARQSDRARLLARVRKETEGLFRAILPVSLLHVKGPPSACTASGMADVMAALDDVLAHPLPVAQAAGAATTAPKQPEPSLEPAPRPRIVPRRVTSVVGCPDSRPARRGGVGTSLL